MRLESFTIRDKGEKKQIIEVLYEDDDILALNKPAGIPVISDHWDPELPHLQGMIQKRYEKLSGNSKQAIWVVHRIDADTSGLVLFSRSKKMHRLLNLLFEKNEIQKTYLAIVQGAPAVNKGTIDLPLKPHATRPQFIQVHKQGKPSITNYKVIEKFKYFSLLEVYPQTGRTHQIRVHLKEIHCPLALDPLYGNRNSIDLSHIKIGYISKDIFEAPPPLISRLTLHAFRIQFRNPISGVNQSFEASPPKDFIAFLKSLRKWNSP
jgi:23S rRNA pseudouridine955/2504/2580 synthase/23S rRNA pseudouridine1911/1915/1917 synthase